MSQSFSPRPEAQATTWDELMPPVKMAVRDLLVRIHGAHHSVRSQNTDKITSTTGSCFLVYGSRGTGKTSVLLNAQKAVCKKSGEKFFEKNFEQENLSEKQAKIQAIKDAKELRDDGIVWLEILNLEPIPDKANLLTILLTQVRNALHTHSDKIKRDQRSIFEENIDSAQQQLSKLINDATLMWENINEPDTRSTSSFQVKAADAYAEFPKKFKQAMDKLIEELSEVRCSDSKVSIVLPIDNIDRSTEHLQSIVKLAQLVTHPNLWLVMAGDRVEVETFLERAYWKELIRSSDGAGARGKIDSDGEDETLAMARRQANAAAQKLWPANHRVEIDLLMPEDTLKFAYKSTSVVDRRLLDHCGEDEKCIPYHNNSNLANAEKTIKVTIGELLKQIQIPTTDDQRIISNKEKKSPVKLFDLFDVSNNIEHIDNPLTRVAWHGLFLPARSVIELWQLLDWLTNDHSSNGNKDFKAEKIARTMLRNAISCSSMPNETAQNLQNDIIRRDARGGSILSFSNISLKLTPLTYPVYDFEDALTPIISEIPSSKCKLRSKLIICNVEDIVLSLQLNCSPTNQLDSSSIDIKDQCLQSVGVDKANKKEEIELPPPVAAWLMVLYDILVLAETDASSWVIAPDVDVVELCNVSIHHTIVTKTEAGEIKNKDIELRWNVPSWGLFLGRNVFGRHWQNFRKELAEDISNHEILKTFMPRFLAVNWIICVLKTSIGLITFIDSNDERFQDLKIPYFDIKKYKDIENILEFEKSMTEFVTKLYEKIQGIKKLGNYKDKDRYLIAPAAYEVILATGQWLETELVYFSSSAYVPISSQLDNSETWFRVLWGDTAPKENSFQKYWQDNLLFILAELKEKYPDVEDDNGDVETIKETITEKTGETTKETTKETSKKTSKPFSKLLFADLYEQLEKAETSSGQ